MKFEAWHLMCGGGWSIAWEYCSQRTCKNHKNLWVVLNNFSEVLVPMLKTSRHVQMQEWIIVHMYQIEAMMDASPFLVPFVWSNSLKNKNPKARSFSMTASSHSLGSRGTGHFPQWHSGHSYYCLRALALLSYVCTRSSWWVKCPENQSPSCYDF